ncbi:hypothetical protein BJ996_007171 [Streptomyces phaeogriseichromatogenes]|nr:hypothetical protein [Streptomyces murinus]
MCSGLRGGELLESKPSSGGGWPSVPAGSGLRRSRALWIRPMWLNACGKLPSRRCWTGSYSSARSARSLRRARRRSNKARASSRRPVRPRPSASQRAQEESALVAGQVVHPGGLTAGPVAVHDPVVRGELTTYGVHRAEDARLVGRWEAGARDEQRGSVQFLRAVGPCEGVAHRGEALVTNLPVDRRPQFDQRDHVQVERAGFGQADGAVDRHPGHHLGVDEVPTGPADLPDALVGLLPAPRQALDEPLVQDRGGGAVGDTALVSTQGLLPDRGRPGFIR